MDDLEIIEFLKMYQKERLLWDQNDPNYHNIDNRLISTERIAKAVGLGVEQVAVTFISLRSIYFEEASKVSTNDEYSPNVEWFEIMAWIMNHVEKDSIAVSNSSTSAITAMKVDEDVPCDVCRSTESEPSNEMVFCDKCNVCVHQACYGVNNIPKGEWYCNPCEENAVPTCIFCPNTNGAMKKTKNGNWAHVSCALWIPEVSFAEPEKIATIVNVENIPKTRWSLLCYLCRLKGGACIQCYNPRCKTAYHVTCAFKHGLHMMMEDIEGSENIKFESFCKGHTANQQRKSKHNKRKNDDLEVEEDKIFAQFLPGVPSTSHDSAIVDKSNSRESIVANGDKVQPVADTTAPSEEDLIRNYINMMSVSKGTARKSICGPPKKIKRVYSHILPKENTKKGAGKKSLPPPWKPRRLEDSSSKKSQTQQSSSKAKHSTDKISGSELQPSADQNGPGMTPCECEQPSLYLPQLLKSAQNSKSSEDSSMTVSNIPQLFQTPPKQHRLSTVPNEHLTPSSEKEHQFQSNHHRSSSSPEIEQRPLAAEGRSHMSSVQINHPPSSEMRNQPLAAERPHMSSTPNNHTPSEMEHQSFAAESRPHMSSVLNNHPTSTELGRRATNKLDNCAEFSTYLASLLRTLPFKKALKVQKKMLSLVLKEHDLSSSDEYDVSSMSSD